MQTGMFGNVWDYENNNRKRGIAGIGNYSGNAQIIMLKTQSMSFT